MSNSDIQNLQIKVAFLEDSLTKMSDEFYLQQRELDELKSQYASLVMKMTGMQNDHQSASEATDERPPHY